MTFLGTSQGQASAHRAQTSIALLRVKDVIIFDAGRQEGVTAWNINKTVFILHAFARKKSAIEEYCL